MGTENKRIENAMQGLGVTGLNSMQQAALEAMKRYRDVILLSPTGTGKTLAFLLPLLCLLKEKEKGVQCLILTPSRELALQINGVFVSMSSGFRSCCCYGGHASADERKSLLDSQTDIVIGTPGRILDHLLRGTIATDVLRTLVIDEFDKLLEFGFHDAMKEIIERLPSLENRMLLSATDLKEIPSFTGLEQAVKLDFLAGGQTNRLRLFRVLSPEKDKLETLYRLLCQLGDRPSVVFVNYREAVTRVGDYLKTRGMENGTFHGGMEQEDRERALYKFRNGSCHVFVSTDLAARGLDIPEIENIIHYHLPVNEEAFTHRNGRTARWNATGDSYLIVNPGETQPAYISGELQEFPLSEHTPKPLPSVWVTLYIGKGKKDKLGKVDVAGFLYKKGHLGKDDIGRIDVRDHYTFVAIRRTRLRQALNLVQGEKIKGMKTIIEEAR